METSDPRPLRLLIATPAAGGMVTVGYLNSLIRTMSALSSELECAVYTLGTESLINRARNTCVMYAVTNHYDMILFIDSDIIWSPEDVTRLLDAKREIIGGTYPLKNYPITLNFNPLPGQEDVPEGPHSAVGFPLWCAKHTNADGIAEVLHIPTGFLLIDMKVFAKLSNTVPWYVNHYADTGKRSQFFEFFPTGVVDHVLESEDWGFCRIARAAGFPIHFHTKVITKHIGTHTYAQTPRAETLAKETPPDKLV
jgi:glycosyltransferase involved in cell wall biosynthesis